VHPQIRLQKRHRFSSLGQAPLHSVASSRFETTHHLGPSKNRAISHHVTNSDRRYLNRVSWRAVAASHRPPSVNRFQRAPWYETRTRSCARPETNVAHRLLRARWSTLRNWIRRCRKPRSLNNLSDQTRTQSSSRPVKNSAETGAPSPK